MSILGAVKKDRLGDWPSIAEYLTDLQRRETNSVAALALALAAAPAGRVRIEELLATAPPDHAGKLAATFALGAAPLPAAHQQQWANLLRELCVAHRRAPEAARRLGLIAPWPPNLPSAFSDLMRQAEQAAAPVTSPGAATGRAR